MESTRLARLVAPEISRVGDLGQWPNWIRLRSPKPAILGSSPSCPATSCSPLRCEGIHPGLYNRSPDSLCGRGVLVAQEPSKLLGRVRFPSPASALPVIPTLGRVSVHARGVAQFGSAFDWGSKGRWFKSSRPDFLALGFLWVGQPPGVRLRGRSGGQTPRARDRAAIAVAETSVPAIAWARFPRQASGSSSTAVRASIAPAAKPKETGSRAEIS